MFIDERMETFLETLWEEMPGYLKELEEEAVRNHVPIIKKQAWAALRFAIKISNPLHILEIGTAVGYSALLMSEAVKPACRITTIEKVPKRIEEAKRNFTRYEKDGIIKLIGMDAEEALKDLVKKGHRYDLVFLDAAKGQYLSLLPQIEKLLELGSFLVADNVLREGDILESRYAVTRRDRTIHGRMREFLHTLSKSPAWETLVLPIGDGITISKWMGS